MKNIVEKWSNENGGKGIFVKDQDLDRVCHSCKVRHIEWGSKK